MAEDASDWKDKGEIFKASYDEVLSALKHQDDKLNRTLTAISFLTAGALAVYGNLGRNAVMTFHGSTRGVVSVIFVIFLISVAFALTSTLAAIGPSRTFPWKPGKQDPSLLFYSSIARNESWGKYIDRENADLQKELAQHYHKEAQIIAKRVEYKVAKAREAGSFLLTLITSLALLGIFSTTALPESLRWRIGVGVLLGMLALPLWELSEMAVFKFPEGKLQGLAYGQAILAASLSGILLWRAEAWREQWPALFYGLGTIFLLRLSLVDWRFARVLLPAAWIGGLLLLIFIAL